MDNKLPAFGIRFDVNKISNADYGGWCWIRFWLIVDIQKLRGVSLFDNLG